MLKKKIVLDSLFQRPYHDEHTSSRLITEVKHHWARSVLRWVTAWEHRVSLVPFSGCRYRLIYSLPQACIFQRLNFKLDGWVGDRLGTPRIVGSIFRLSLSIDLLTPSSLHFPTFQL